MTDQEYAARLIANCSRRLSGVETAICQAIQDSSDEENIMPGVFISIEDRRAFDGLKTQFASELR